MPSRDGTGEQIAAEATAAGAAFVACVAYDPAVTYAQVAGSDIIDYGGRATTKITAVWEAVDDVLSTSPEPATGRDG